LRARDVVGERYLLTYQGSQIGRVGFERSEQRPIVSSGAKRYQLVKGGDLIRVRLDVVGIRRTVIVDDRVSTVCELKRVPSTHGTLDPITKQHAQPPTAA